MMKITLCIFLFLVALAQAQDVSWLKDAKLMLGEDMKESFRAKDRLKEIEFLDDLLRTEMLGANREIVLKIVKELKLKSLRPDLMSMAEKKPDRDLYLLINSLTDKQDFQGVLDYYEALKKKKIHVSYLPFMDLAEFYNYDIPYTDLLDFYEDGDEETKVRFAQYILGNRQHIKNHHFSLVINVAIRDGSKAVKTEFLLGMRRLPDAELKLYEVNYNICLKDADKKVATLCKDLAVLTGIFVKTAIPLKPYKKPKV